MALVLHYPLLQQNQPLAVFALSGLETGRCSHKRLELLHESDPEVVCEIAPIFRRRGFHQVFERDRFGQVLLSHSSASGPISIFPGFDLELFGLYRICLFWGEPFFVSVDLSGYRLSSQPRLPARAGRHPNPLCPKGETERIPLCLCPGRRIYRARLPQQVWRGRHLYLQSPGLRNARQWGI